MRLQACDKEIFPVLRLSSQRNGWTCPVPIKNLLSYVLKFFRRVYTRPKNMNLNISQFSTSVNSAYTKWTVSSRWPCRFHLPGWFVTNSSTKRAINTMCVPSQWDRTVESFGICWTLFQIQLSDCLADKNIKIRRMRQCKFKLIECLYLVHVCVNKTV